MSSKRLGKGINAIINPDSRKNANSSNSSGVNKVKINNIKPNPNQPRRDFDKKSLEELSLSIKNKGVITPITLRKSGKHYEICLLYTSPSPRDLSTSRMPSSA